MTRHLFTTADARFALATPQGVDADGDGSPGTLSGYAIRWNTISSDRGGYSVRLLPGSATFASRTLALVNHDVNQLLASTDTNTLRITPDDVGVRVEIDLPDTTYAEDAAALVAAKLIKGCSFSMLGSPTGKKTVENGVTIVNVAAFDCDEITITPIPAFVETSIGIKPADVPSAFADRIRQRLTLDRMTLATLRV